MVSIRVLNTAIRAQNSEANPASTVQGSHPRHRGWGRASRADTAACVTLAKSLHLHFIFCDQIKEAWVTHKRPLGLRHTLYMTPTPATQRKCLP